MKLKNKFAVILIASTSLICFLSAGLTFLLIASLGLANPACPGKMAVVVTGIIAFIGTLFVAITLPLIDKMIRKPIRQLATVMRAISATNNLSLRVPFTATSEVAQVIDTINRMLDTTENYHLDMLAARYEVENANKGKSLFIAKVSHELRTPIHGITGMLRILLKQETATGKRQYIQMAQDSALALLETINEILDFSKMQNGSLSFEEAPFDLIEVVRLTVEHLIPRFEEKPGLALCWDIAPDVPNVVIGDAARIRNVLINLLGNAFKFADHGHITLRVSSYQCSDLKKHGFRFSVTDTGIGISSNKLNTIFDPFTTADEKTARLYAGAGLGLAIVKQITEKLGGSISVESEPDQGSTFSVDLPLAVASEATDTDVTTTKTYKVAVLATPDIRQTTVAHGLSAFGCTVSLFSLDNPEQLEILQANCSHFDIIHVIKAKDILMDELNPLIHAAAKNNVRIVFSVTSAEISSSDLLARSDKCFVTLQPTSALDILLICEGKLTPKSSLRETDEPAEKADQKLNILIADDTKTNRIILKNLLEDAGHNVEVVENGKQLLERIAFKPEHFDRQQLPFDLVLTDIQMPVMDGITATQNFRELERQSNASKKLPIVAVTSYAFPEECSKMLASGIDHILTKPINPKRLSRLISQITSQSEQLSQSQEDEQTDPQIIEQLCQLTETVVQRIRELNSAIVSHPNEPSTTVLDLQGVYERSGNSIRRTGLILTSFLESYQEQLLILEATKLKDEDPAKLRRLVHALKGLLLDAGAQTAANLAVALEDKMVREPQAVTMQEILKFVNSVHEAARVIKEIANALPSFEIYSALPSIGHELMVH